MANYQNVVPNQLAQAALGTGYAVLYTAPKITSNAGIGTTAATVSSIRTYLKQMDICNTTAGALTLFVSIVPPAGSPGAANALYYGISIAANATLTWQGTQVLVTGATLQAHGSAVGLTLTASGGEAT